MNFPDLDKMQASHPRWEVPSNWVVCLNLSGGTQSSFLFLAMRLGLLKPVSPNGDWATVVCIIADPGNENPETYNYLDWLKENTTDRLPVLVADGPNITDDLLDNRNRSRLDNPPFFVDKGDLGAGQLVHKCTSHYKIQPIRRAFRKWCRDKFKIDPATSSHRFTVDCWIGFTSDEVRRVNRFDHSSQPQYMPVRFPLNELNIDKQQVSEFYEEFGIPMPSRSMCEICFAHGLSSRKKQAEERPGQFELACKVDDEIRDLRHCGVTYPVYVSNTLIPLRKLKENGFSTGNRMKDAESECNSGVCFL
ncbi:hypothetical protein KOR42_05680 [Thalassoglobus neptunius]|uniref:Phosphoadenosine phosphosulphate reductase domain-containing protein n=1 Tax=Thalassoglobus neptunius TaxID=1938619 RepID=A0A5C5X312_9PLAN|nr:hypothetical protein [Thalassoglobus neptunius]TWT57210.1 hypothetical protein KOR42_05680 [Thalassoglobus neptunius]